MDIVNPNWRDDVKPTVKLNDAANMAAVSSDSISADKPVQNETPKTVSPDTAASASQTDGSVSSISGNTNETVNVGGSGTNADSQENAAISADSTSGSNNKGNNDAGSESNSSSNGEVLYKFNVHKTGDGQYQQDSN